MSRKIKTDFILALSLIVLCILLSFYNWSNTEFKSTDLTGADLSCDRDRVNYQGYFTLGNITYYSSERYETCNHFYQQMQGKNLYGTYFASNNRLTTLYVDGVLENYYSMGMVIGWGLMMAFVSFFYLEFLLNGYLARKPNNALKQENLQLAVFTAFNILANYKFPLNEAL